MKATIWNWPSKRKVTSSPFWEKVRTLSNDFGEPIISVLEIPGSFIPGVGAALGALKALYRAGLNLSSIDNAHSIKPMVGAPGPFTSKEGDAAVFLDGFDVSFTISHNGKGKEGISLEYIDVCLLSYTPGEDKYYQYQLAGEEIIGAGLVEPLRFFVSLDSDGVNAPRRSIVNKEGRTELLTATGPNFFNTEPSVYYTFTAAEPPLIIKTNVMALEQGFYELCFRFFYRVAGKELCQYTSSKILLYCGG